MTTILKTIQIPADHQVHLDLDVPGEIPVGQAEILMIISPVASPRRRDRLPSLAGRLARSRNFSRDPVQLQREMRDDWE